ncbi:MAG: hypothetical protein ACE5FA_15085 [Dehalococcoidia bacterium]
MNASKNITQQSCTNSFTANAGTCVPFDSIQEPGCYICNWNGHLVRIPEDGVTPGRSPMLAIVGAEPLFVTKISDNPFVTVTKARLLASNFDLPVNF